MKFKEIYKNIDSLYISFKGTLKEGIRETLEQKKGFAQSDDEKMQALATLIIDEHCFEVMDKGKGKYAFVLVDGWYHLQVSSSISKRLPTVYVQVSSDLLHGFGSYIALNQLRGLVAELLVNIEEEIISRVDIFVDFISDAKFESIGKGSWVTRANNIHSYWSGNDFTGWSIGQGGVISARLYDKTIEIEKSGKDYFKSIWEKNGWQSGQRIWRLEFQLRREFLSQMSMNKFLEFAESSNDVWRYCTHDWLRLTVNGGSRNRARFESHWVWDKIQQVKFDSGNYTGIMRHVEKSRLPKDKTIFLNGMGYLTSFAVSRGYKTISDQVLKEFMHDGGKFLSEYTKSSPSYSDKDDYINTKIRLKEKKFSTRTEEDEWN